MPSRVLLVALAVVLPIGSAFANPVEGTYHLRPGSTLRDACFDSCTCEIPNPVALRGRFRLESSTADPVFQNFNVRDLAWRAASAGLTLSGAGTYQVTDLQPGSARLNLDISIQGQPSARGEFGRRVYGGSPVIDAAIVLPKTDCSQTVLTILATPLRSDWNADALSDLTDLFAFLESWFGADGDANDDGQNTLADVFSFLDAWFIGA